MSMENFYDWLEKEYLSEIEKMLEKEEMSYRKKTENPTATILKNACSLQ